MNDLIEFVIDKKSRMPEFNTQKDNYRFILESFKELKTDEVLKFPLREGQEKRTRSKGYYIIRLIKNKLSLEAGTACKNGFMYIYKKG